MNAFFDLSSLAEDGGIIIRPGLLDWAIGEDLVEVIIYTAEAEDGIMWMQFKASVRADAEKINETI